MRQGQSEPSGQKKGGVWECKCIADASWDLPSVCPEGDRKEESVWINTAFLLRTIRPHSEPESSHPSVCACSATPHHMVALHTCGIVYQGVFSVCVSTLSEGKRQDFQPFCISGGKGVELRGQTGGSSLSTDSALRRSTEHSLTWK